MNNREVATASPVNTRQDRRASGCSQHLVERHRLVCHHGHIALRHPLGTFNTFIINRNKHSCLIINSKIRLLKRHSCFFIALAHNIFLTPQPQEAAGHKRRTEPAETQALSNGSICSCGVVIVRPWRGAQSGSRTSCRLGRGSACG